ncbi:MAG: divalent-cation tolerance protein CutA [Candidatus Krumholzibacteriales bacterium]
MDSYIQVITTVDDREDAQRIARAVVEKRLAACVQIIGPVSSMYWWEDNIVEENEHICLMKTRENLYRELEQAIIDEHAYEIPEIVAVPVSAGSAGYFEWMDRELKGDKSM